MTVDASTRPAPGAETERAEPARRPRADWWSGVRFILSWAAGIGLVVAIVPRTVNTSWHGLPPILGAVRWPAALALVGVWFLGLYVHSFVLAAAAPNLTRRRAL